jgi:hypothetical protein
MCWRAQSILRSPSSSSSAAATCSLIGAVIHDTTGEVGKTLANPAEIRAGR